MAFGGVLAKNRKIDDSTVLGRGKKFPNLWVFCEVSVGAIEYSTCQKS